MTSSQKQPRRPQAARYPCLVLAACGLAMTAAPVSAQLTEPFPAVFELEQLRDRSGGDGALGFSLIGDSQFSRAGISVSSAGDVNGDGIDDIIIGAPGIYAGCGYCSGYPSRSYVVFGRDTGAGPGFPADLNLIDLDGSDGFRLDADPTGDDRGGAAVSSAGDINGDGIDDLLVGAVYSGVSGAGFVVFGRDTIAGPGFPAVVDLYALDGSTGFRLEGPSFSEAGGAVATAGDVNGDGLDDIIIGADFADAPGRPLAGQSYVVFGRASFPAVFDLTTVNGANGFRIDGASSYDQSGGAVASAGDVNHDGIPDIIIGAEWADPGGRDRAGQSFVVFGRDTTGGPGFPAALDLAALDGSDGFALNGVASRDHSGGAVSYAGDLNADGVDDIVIGARQADTAGGSGAGRSYVVFGRDTSGGPAFPAALELSSLDGATGFRADGSVVNDESGIAVASAGDLNGDGIDDLIIGASGVPYIPGYYIPGDSEGRSYVIFGRTGAFPAVLDLAALGGATGFRLDGSEQNDRSGLSVAAAGDVNADGRADFIVGAPALGSAIPGPPGKAYVVFGRGPDAACYADCDGSGSLDFFDFLCFQNQFAAGDPQADCDESGELDFFDFLCFQSAFAAGCP